MFNTPPSSVPPAQDPAGDKRNQNWVLACICACTILVIGFVSSINLAVPQLAASSLAPTASQLLWVVDAYVVLFACLVIPAGALGDRYGRKGVLMCGLLVFAVGVTVSALAPNVPIMLTGRAVTGVGAAAVLPNALAVLIQATTPARRPHAIGIWAARSGAGGVVGNVGGGAVLTAGSWRWLFAVVAPIAAICLAWVAAVAPRSERHNRPLDVWAAALLTAATIALLLGIVEGPDQGWSSAFVITAFAAAALLFSAWVFNGLRTAHPLLDPRLFRIPALRAACLGMVTMFFGLFGFFYLNASLLQYGRGFGALQTGLAVIPLTVPLLLGPRLLPRLITKIGEKAVLAGAFVLVALGIFGLATAIDRSYPVYALWMVVVGCGITLALPTLTMTISAALPSNQAGVAGGLQATTREFGSALGVAVIGTMLTARFTDHLTDQTHNGNDPRTVAQVLADMPGHRRTVIDAYTGAADTSLKVVALIVLAVGALILAELNWASRASRTATDQQ